MKRKPTSPMMDAGDSACGPDVSTGGRALLGRRPAFSMSTEVAMSNDDDGRPESG